MKKRTAMALWALMLCVLMLANTLTVFASSADTINYSKKGTININVLYGDIPVEGAEFTVFRVAGFDKSKKNPTLVLTPETKGYKVKPSAFKQEDAFGLMDYVEANQIKGKSKKSDKNGKIRFDSLELGVYLVEQTGSVEGYGTCRPFLVTIPHISSGKWSYSVDATPKVDVERLVDVTVTIIWPPDTPFPPDGIIIELYDGDELIDTIVLTNPEDLTHVWKDLPEGDYSIKINGVPEDYNIIYDEETKSFVVVIEKAEEPEEEPKPEEEKKPELIKTGQNKLIAPFLALSGFVSLAAGVALLKRGRKDYCD